MNGPTTTIDQRSPQEHQLTAERLLRWSAAELDACFRSAAPGPVPAGRTAGVAVIAPGTRLAAVLARLTRLAAWRGKEFTTGQDGLVNLVSPLGIRAIRARVCIEPSWVDNRPCIVIDYSTTSWSARWVRDEIREVAPGLYVGVVFVRRRRLPLRFVLTYSP